mgnify:CR=1 FL=1
MEVKVNKLTLYNKQFPKSNKYDDSLPIKLSMGLNVLWLTELLTENINLNNNQLDPYFAAEIGKTFELNKQIKSLDFSNNELLDLGVTMIARYVQKLDSLTTLNLANNKTTELGVYMVDESLKLIGKPENFSI